MWTSTAAAATTATSSNSIAHTIFCHLDYTCKYFALFISSSTQTRTRESGPQCPVIDTIPYVVILIAYVKTSRYHLIVHADFNA